PFWRACPNAASLAMSCMRGQGRLQTDRTFASLPVNVTLERPYRFDIIAGRSYALSGDVMKLEDGRTTIMHVNYSMEHRLIPGAEQVELGPMIILGSGKITRVRYSNSANIENPTLELVVAHDPVLSAGEWRRLGYGPDGHSSRYQLFSWILYCPRGKVGKLRRASWAGCCQGENLHRSDNKNNRLTGHIGISRRLLRGIEVKTS
ncbi:hypothetical protein PSHT_00211, partial [Puccinia striiformis]